MRLGVICAMKLQYIFKRGRHAHFIVENWWIIAKSTYTHSLSLEMLSMHNDCYLLNIFLALA